MQTRNIGTEQQCTVTSPLTPPRDELLSLVASPRIVRFESEHFQAVYALCLVKQHLLSDYCKVVRRGRGGVILILLQRLCLALAQLLFGLTFIG
jgi:hypothetical protein